MIVQTAKAGGANPESNVRLGEVLRAAKLAEVPRDIIDRNLKKASDRQQADFSEMTYEAYGAGGTGFVIECLTDNVNRSATEVRTAVTKSGCKMADSGSVLFNFQRQGLLFVPAGVSEDQVFEAAMDSGAEDIQRAEGNNDVLEGFKVLTSADKFAAVRSGLQALEVAIAEDRSGLVFMPLSTIEVDDAAYEANEALMERLLAVDDVDAVHTNCAGLA
ncbi:hypothetical protein WJX81_001800 [Elliptochloris bilobata]|uniref:Transcriptional regulatory protein n=1 Tax=Elliptochloris bilobata TaxID=381761 RepID=A0AAW1QLX2_9CHLO